MKNKINFIFGTETNGFAYELLNIEFDENEAHNSDYDTLKYFEVFIKTIN